MASSDIGEHAPITLRNLPKYELDIHMKEILIPADRLFARIAELGEQISNDYRGGEPPLLVSILKGGVVFLTDLMRYSEYRGIPIGMPRPDPINQKLAADDPGHLVHKLSPLGLAATAAGRGIEFAREVSTIVWNGQRPKKSRRSF